MPAHQRSFWGFNFEQRKLTKRAKQKKVQCNFITRCSLHYPPPPFLRAEASSSKFYLFSTSQWEHSSKSEEKMRLFGFIGGLFWVFEGGRFGRVRALICCPPQRANWGGSYTILTSFILLLWNCCLGLQICLGWRFNRYGNCAIQFVTNDGFVKVVCCLSCNCATMGYKWGLKPFECCVTVVS